MRAMMTAAVLAAGFGATGAQAQCGSCAPPPAYPAPYAPLPYADLPYDDRVFDGARVEAHISYDRLLARFDDPRFGRSNDRDGLGYGGEVGYDFAVGRSLVLGAYASIDGSTIRSCSTVAAVATLCLKPGRYIDAGGRIGVTLGRTTMLYAKGGYTNGQIRATFRNPLDPSTNLDLRENRDGFHVGGGLETSFAARTYGKIEYLYTRLRRVGADEDGDGGIDVDRHQVQAGVGVRF